MNSCDHITNCTECKKHICAHCVEDCSGCPIEACENCYTRHLVKCSKCPSLVCPMEMIGKICPSCDMQEMR